ncbi:hypothetical protein GF374_01955 [Candidatus Woesearchaeota archaeon]|nr:hypothetical protein [Candidatus Woesearchaeota archaeon]
MPEKNTTTKKKILEIINSWDDEEIPEEERLSKADRQNIVFSYLKDDIYPGKDVRPADERRGFERSLFAIIKEKNLNKLIKAGYNKETIDDIQKSIKNYNILLDLGNIPGTEKKYSDIFPMVSEGKINPNSEFYVEMWHLPTDFETTVELTLGMASKKDEIDKKEKYQELALGLFLDFIGNSDYLEQVKEKYNIKIKRHEKDITLKETLIQDKNEAKEKALKFLEAIIEKIEIVYNDYANEIESTKISEKIEYYKENLEEIVTEDIKVGYCPIDPNPSNFLVYLDKKGFLKKRQKVRRAVIDQKATSKDLIFGPLSFLKGYLIETAKKHNLPAKIVNTISKNLKEIYTNDKIAEIGKLYADIKYTKYYRKEANIVEKSYEEE